MPEIESTGPLAAVEFHERFELTETPVVIRGGARGWPALDRWSPAYLVNKLGDVELDHKLSSCHQHPDFHAPSLKEMFSRARLPLSALLDAITAGPVQDRARRLFTGDERFLLQRRGGIETKDPVLAGLLDDLELLPYLPQERLYTIWAWFSGAGVRTWLHYDNNGCHNLNAQINGEKRCALYPPTELSRMHPFELGGPNPAYNCSALDVEAAELPDDFRGAVSYEATLGAGDLLFIPAWWFHTFTHVGAFNSNVNFWWKPARPGLNPVAKRQALLDAVAHSKVDVRSDPSAAALLSTLDRALVSSA